uniref:Uncharacterized protein n=1 Tax=Anopheles quadriannulatus TaxID=34691 RepID=A0A182XS39_ANOQN
MPPNPPPGQCRQQYKGSLFSKLSYAPGRTCAFSHVLLTNFTNRWQCCFVQIVTSLC